MNGQKVCRCDGDHARRAQDARADGVADRDREAEADAEDGEQVPARNCWIGSGADHPRRGQCNGADGARSSRDERRSSQDTGWASLRAASCELRLLLVVLDRHRPVHGRDVHVGAAASELDAARGGRRRQSSSSSSCARLRALLAAFGAAGDRAAAARLDDHARAVAARDLHAERAVLRRGVERAAEPRVAVEMRPRAVRSRPAPSSCPSRRGR